MHWISLTGINCTSGSCSSERTFEATPKGSKGSDPQGMLASANRRTWCIHTVKLFSFIIIFKVLASESVLNLKVVGHMSKRVLQDSHLEVLVCSKASQRITSQSVYVSKLPSNLQTKSNCTKLKSQNIYTIRTKNQRTFRTDKCKHARHLHRQGPPHQAHSQISGAARRDEKNEKTTTTK